MKMLGDICLSRNSSAFTVAGFPWNCVVNIDLIFKNSAKEDTFLCVSIRDAANCVEGSGTFVYQISDVDFIDQHLLNVT